MNINLDQLSGDAGNGLTREEIASILLRTTPASRPSLPTVQEDPRSFIGSILGRQEEKSDDIGGSFLFNVVSQSRRELLASLLARQRLENDEQARQLLELRAAVQARQASAALALAPSSRPPRQGMPSIFQSTQSYETRRLSLSQEPTRENCNIPVQAVPLLPNQPSLPTHASLPTASIPQVASLPEGGKKKGRKGAFPKKLLQMLADLEKEQRQDIASFLPHERSFAIHKPREFVNTIMPKYFRMSRFSSFQRQLNLYNFHRVTEGPERGSYHHPLFMKGRYDLCSVMKRTKIKGVAKTKKEGGDENEDDETSEEEK